MIYLNNAATTYPKPQCVIDAHTAALNALPLEEGRSTLAPMGDGVMDCCRKNIAKVLGTKRWQRVFFTSGATDSANRLLGGLPLRGVPVFVTQTEHNSILRPIFNNEATAKNACVIECDGVGRVSADAVEAAISHYGTANVTRHDDGGSPLAGLLIVNQCSNVTGVAQDIATLCDIAHSHKMLCMVDAAQSGGTMQVGIDDTEADIVVFTGHKGLLGPQGTGGYFIRDGVPLRPTMFGGTGRNSKQITYEQGDHEYEVGTQNLTGIAALNAGVEHIISTGMSRIVAEEHRKMHRMRAELSQMETVTLYGGGSSQGDTILSFNIKGMNPSDIGYILQNAYGIIVRTGIHCSPLIHKALGTYEHGTVRASISHLTPDDDIEAFIQAVKDIAQGVTI